VCRALIGPILDRNSCARAQNMGQKWPKVAKTCSPGADLNRRKKVIFGVCRWFRVVFSGLANPKHSILRIFATPFGYAHGLFGSFDSLTAAWVYSSNDLSHAP
jgi:hypothetical protein